MKYSYVHCCWMPWSMDGCMHIHHTLISVGSLVARVQTWCLSDCIDMNASTAWGNGRWARLCCKVKLEVKGNYVTSEQGGNKIECNAYRESQGGDHRKNKTLSQPKSHRSMHWCILAFEDGCSMSLTLCRLQQAISGHTTHMYKVNTLCMHSPTMVL